MHVELPYQNNIFWNLPMHEIVLRIPKRAYQSHRVRLACEPPTSSFFSQNQPATNHQYFSLRTNQHQPPAKRTRQSEMNNI
jgi:hypothetical protein